MQNIFKNLQTLLIVALIIIILFLRNCSGDTNPTPDPTIITKIEYKWDTLHTETPIYIPKWKDRVKYKIDTIYIDTNKVVEDYFASYYYEDSISNDSITITIKDTISRNKIKNRALKYSILYPTKTITRDSIVNKRGFYAGIGVGGTTSYLNYIGGELLFNSRKKTAFGIGVGVNQEFKPVFNGRLYWKLGK